jgi:myo-inositol-1(or 4)-monophosphatase
MKLINPKELEKTAAEAARAGGAVIREARSGGEDIEVTVKGRNDFVTQVDLKAEAAVVELIRKRHPDHGILAEESPETNPGGPVRWIIDPLDGTTNFIHGFPAYSVSVGAARNSENSSNGRDVLAGAIYDPIRDEMFTASEGGGAFLNGATIGISPRETLEDSLLLTGFPFRAQELLQVYLKIFAGLHGRSHGIRRAGSAALDMAYVAAGRAEAFFEFWLSPWDMAAGTIIVKEAGGVITDFEGGDQHMESGNIVAGKVEIVNEVLNEIRKHYP